MPQAETTHDAELVAELNDLLELDHDAVGAYTLAIETIESEVWRQDLIRYREDHQRHIRDLTRLIRAQGGDPIEMPHIPTGAFKSAVQAAAAAGSDREVLLAFKANEGQVRDKYRRAAQREHSTEVAELLRRNARDEEVHYTWVVEALERIGAGPDTAVGRAEAGFERVHGGAADMIEGAEREMMEASDRWNRSPGRLALGTVAAVGLGALLVRQILK